MRPATRDQRAMDAYAAGIITWDAARRMMGLTAPESDARYGHYFRPGDLFLRWPSAPEPPTSIVRQMQRDGTWDVGSE